MVPLDFLRPSSTPVSGTLDALHRSPRYIRTRLTGRFDLALANQLISTIDAWRGTHSGVMSFSDCSALEDYDIAARQRASAWTRTHAPAFDAIHLLVRSRPIAWAAQLFSVMSGATVVTHHSLESFEKAFARRRDDAQ